MFWSLIMREFRAYLIDADGHITGRIDLVVQDEKEAKETAKQLVDGHAVELWEGATKLARFEPIQEH
jgi:hypothetical protein